MKVKIMAIPFLLATVLIGCSENNIKEPSQESQKNDVSTSQEVAGDVKQLINDLSLRKIDGKSASIFSEKLIVQDSDGTTLDYELPKDVFFVSIAPYIKETHP